MKKTITMNKENNQLQKQPELLIRDMKGHVEPVELKANETRIYIEHSDITVKRIVKGVFSANTVIFNPIRTEVTITGRTEEEAVTKLKQFLKDSKRPLHTMTPLELQEWTGQYFANPERRIEELTSSLFHFFHFIAAYGNFNSIKWLLEHNFDLEFTEAKKSSTAKL